MNAVTLSLEDLALDEAEWCATEVERVVTPPYANGLVTEGQLDWATRGYVVLPGFLPDDLIDLYSAEWRAAGNGPGGWPDSTPYMRSPALRDLCCYGPLQQVLAHLIGEPMGVHLNLTGWVSTERDWHADSYLNAPYVGGHYAAVWMALDDIDPRSGPFQIVPGSCRWPQVSQAKIKAALGEDGTVPMWPKHSERILTPLYEREIAERGAEVFTWVPSRGDVLVWNGRAVHRGSRAEVPGMERRACIAHYSGVSHRPDMPPALPHGGGHYFPLEGGPVS